MRRITFVTGGAKSGKSRFALELAENYKERTFLATAEAFDDEMQKRIQLHKAEREEKFKTLEEPIYLSRAVSNASPQGVLLLDCLTVWLGNLLHYIEDDTQRQKEIDQFLAVLGQNGGDIIIVSNEVGMGLVPSGSLGREFRDLAGRLNQMVAQLAQQVYLVVSGIPVIIKGEKDAGRD